MVAKIVPRSSAPPEPAAIFRQEFRYVWFSLRRMGEFERDLEDITHEVFLRVSDQLELYDSERPLRPWLFALALGVAANYRRLARHKVELRETPPETLDPSHNAEELIEQRENQELVHDALQLVPLEQRAVLMLHEIDGYSIPEIATGAFGYRAFGPATRVLHLERPAPPIAVRVVTLSVAGPPVLPGAPETAESRPEKDATSRTSGRAQATAPALSNERQLLDQARRHMSEGELAEALQLLERHGRVYPAGTLIEEREAMAVNALVGLGHYEQARRRGEAFRARHPSSLVLPSVEAALAAIPTEEGAPR